MFKYATSKRAEYLPDPVRFYFNGVTEGEIPGASTLNATAWRKKYPELAAWIKKNFDLD
jgi:hypothetical protein